tara:strand:+ start:948 stop:1127 length:180 start_codon:yes stop_codon:yes gene_type:complete
MRVRTLVQEGQKYEGFTEEQLKKVLTTFFKDFGRENPMWSRSRTVIADDVNEALRRIFE